MYASMYFDIKRKQDPDKMWIPGYDIRTVINKIMEKTGFTSYFRVHNMDDVEKFASDAPMAKAQIIHINYGGKNNVELVDIVRICMNILDDSGYILIDNMFPYYKEFENTQYQAFVKLRQDVTGYQFNTLWDCSKGLGVITKGEDQFCTFDVDSAWNLDYDGFEYFFRLCMNPVDTQLFLNNITNRTYRYKYSVITALFDNYEILREVQNPRDDVEYIVVTDNPELKSSTWKVKLIDSFFDGMSGYAKSFYIKYHPFEFINSDVFLWVDGSIQIKDDFTDEIMVPFINSNYEILELVNTVWNIGEYELTRWYENGFHGFDKEQYDMSLKLFDKEKWLDEMQVQTTIYGGKNTRLLNLVNGRTWDIMRRDSGNNHDVTILYMPQRGQVISKYIWNTHKAYYLDSCTLFSKYFDYCFHNSTESQKSDWDSVDNNLENFIWGMNENPIFPKKVTR